MAYRQRHRPTSPWPWIVGMVVVAAVAVGVVIAVTGKGRLNGETLGPAKVVAPPSARDTKPRHEAPPSFQSIDELIVALPDNGTNEAMLDVASARLQGGNVEVAFALDSSVTRHTPLRGLERFPGSKDGSSDADAQFKLVFDKPLYSITHAVGETAWKLQFRFAESHREQLSSLQRGGRVTVRGVILKVSPNLSGGIVEVENCSVMSVSKERSE